MISGRYVSAFRSATHSIPDGMHMNADYPFMLPKITSVTRDKVTIESNGKSATAKIIRRGGKEYFWLEQSSTFETIYGRPPQRFKFRPFKDESTEITDPLKLLR